MNKSYPIMLQLNGRKVVVSGGGKVAERKVVSLLDTGAKVLVVSPEATEKLKQLALEGKIIWQQRSFSADDVSDAFLIFAATNDKEVNQMVRSAASDHQLVTIADDPEESDFHVPAHFKRGRLSITVSTGGASPILASQIREQMEQQFDETYEEYLEFLFKARQRILWEVQDPSLKRQLLTAIISPEFLKSKNREDDFQKLLDEYSL
ncbi:NAD(P)-binding protein [Neobacillus massiliamazoniensis]|uniref:precorrin-2 dehydrogenase n=1 Tax=Neobacillus massiliamazoniensis TaxID=1499688 RepID=A0A0U1NWL1_9BACI|nr:NAD(P)-binding protein [Neobacillus massiliamazoniensis]CRK82400.1 precorrin-2 dehydrogenase [Neobacillus massiliamazoniensis]